jgi:NAD(P)-dependent dehydrogenase (short-subunit alcohol dehydrogenase family)
LEVDLTGRVALLTGQDGGVMRAVSAALSRSGARVLATQDPSAGNVVAEAFNQFGRLDVLVTCATDDVKEATSVIHAASSPMREARAGRIVSVVSAAGLVPLRGQAARSVAHSGLLMLTRTLALELAEAGVLVNAVAAGALQDDDGVVATADQRMLSHVPLARAGKQEDIADAVLFLVDPDNSYMTGHVLTVDGGWSIGFGRDF